MAAKKGNKNKAIGKAFEDRVYADLEKQGWCVSRWMKNIELSGDLVHAENLFGLKTVINGRLVPARPSIRMMPTKSGFLPVLTNSWTGTPDFIAFKYQVEWSGNADRDCYEVMGVECKSDGKITQAERLIFKAYLDKSIFSKILIASKDPTKRGKILYTEFKYE